MRTKRVNRYYCDFCRKAGQSKHHLQKHESRCTLNPNRVCGVCKMLERHTRPMAELIALLPAWNDPQTPDDVPDINNCPACILAAIRQSGAAVWAAGDFDFTKEMKVIWDDINEKRVGVDW
jgi:hypothetical protein